MAIRSTDLPSRRVRDNFNQNVMGKGFKIPAGNKTIQSDIGNIY